MEFKELLQVGEHETLNFFFAGLYKKVPAGVVTRDETVHVASVLASGSLTSRYDTESIPTLTDLSEVFDEFFIKLKDSFDQELLEMAGAQILLLNGFFRGQMRRRHNVRWYDKIGSDFYERAAAHTTSARRGTLFCNMSRNFPIWTMICWELSQEMRESRYLLYLE
ncbi:MAG: hypothetical protein HYT69_00680 [Candidatus Zambryskibacteria bacterium]|nr:hypothetical protein [Candidatus Zambryskibacteria bacterium]